MYLVPIFGTSLQALLPGLTGGVRWYASGRLRRSFGAGVRGKIRKESVPIRKSLLPLSPFPTPTLGCVSRALMTFLMASNPTFLV